MSAADHQSKKGATGLSTTVFAFAGYQAQNAVTGLPLQMCAEELRLAESQGQCCSFPGLDAIGLHICGTQH